MLSQIMMLSISWLIGYFNPCHGPRIGETCQSINPARMLTGTLRIQ